MEITRDEPGRVVEPAGETLQIPAVRPALSRALLLTAALALTAATLAYTAFWLYLNGPVATTMSEDLGLPVERLLQPPVRLGFQLRYVAERGVLARGVDAGGPAEAAGLRQGDLIVAVDGRSLAESAAPFLAAYRSARPGDPIELAVARPGHARPIVLKGTFAERPLTDRLVPAMRALDRSVRLFPVVFLAVALPVLFLRMTDPHAWRVAVVFICIAGVARTPASFAGVDASVLALAIAWRGACSGLLAFFAYLFFSSFPARSPVDRRLPWLRWLLLTLGLLFALGATGVGRPGEPSLPAPLAAALGDTLTSSLWYAYNYGGLILALVCLLATLASTTSAEARRKIRVLVFGAVAGLAPVVLVSVLTDAGIWQPPGWLTTIVYVTVYVLPLSFAYAVVKHRVLELPVILKRSARYILVRRGFAVLLFLLGAQASALFAVTFARLLRVDPSQATMAGVGFGFLLAGASAPLVRRATRLIDRSFFRDAYDARLVLEELAEQIRTVTSREDLASLLRQQIGHALHPSSTVVYLASPGGTLHTGDEAVPAAARDVRQDAPGFGELARRAHPRRLSPETSGDDFAMFAALGPECLVPIVGRERQLLGLAVLGPRLSEEPYSAEDERLLQSVAGQAGVTLENMALAARIAERLQAEQKAAHEIELARRVQAKLLPQGGPHLRTLEYAGRCVQARAVGGDYYDFLDVGDGRMGLVLADVSGKGFAAALLVASLHASLRSQSPRTVDLGAQLQTVNRLLYEATEANRYATLFLGLFDDADSRLRYVNCGHNPPLLLRGDGSVQRLAPTAMVIGLVEDWTAAEEEIPLRPGDLLVIYSDGITEAMDASGEEFGEARLISAVQAHRDRDAAALLDVVFEAVRRFSAGEQGDDQTMVIAHARD